MKPNVRKAPGGRMNTSILKSSGKSRKLKIVPLPNSSRKIPSMVSPNVKPNPMPIPSQADANGVFFAAKDSARPRMTQFTTIRGMNSPSDLFTSGR